MIRIFDAAVLAYTKLRTHKVRTGLTVGVAGILFGLILAVIMVAQGIFDSVERFSKVGLGDRALVSISQFSTVSFNPYDHADDAAFVSEVEQYHASVVAKKAAAAKKYAVTYNPVAEDPSPIEVDSVTKQKRISDAGLSSVYVQDRAEERYKKEHKALDLETFLAPYSTATVLPDNVTVQPSEGSLVYMKQGKEALDATLKQDYMYGNGAMNGDEPTLTILNGTITAPFVSNTAFDASKGEIPVIIPYAQAEKLLGLQKLAKDSTNQERLDRLGEVRSRVGEITGSYCYRNQASQQLVAQAVMQQEDIKRNTSNKDYREPSLLYTAPSETDCGAVTVAKDARTAAEKAQATRELAYQKEVGEYLGEPVQRKVVVRGVGVSSDMPESITGTVGQAVSALLSSWLSYGAWPIPADLLRQMPEEDRPSYIFNLDEGNYGSAWSERFSLNAYIVEFGDKAEARDALERGGMFGSQMTDDISATPFGSSSLMLDEMKQWFGRALFWTLLVVGAIAVIILASLIGRTVSEGRRESAIFRAIGARRSDISMIYGTYALLLAARTALFALVLGGVIAVIIELLYGQDATVGARLAYAATDTDLQFRLVSIASWYIPLILGTIIVVGLVASVVPILLGARRNPIRDMRDDR